MPRTAGEHAIELLQTALDTYKERNARYKNSFSRWGPVFQALFIISMKIINEFMKHY